MTEKDLLRIRLQNLQIADTNFLKPEELLSWVGGIQAQDYEQAKYSIGVRIPGLTDADVENAIAERRIVRSWPMRNTLHFVNAADLKWMLKLLAPDIDSITKSVNYKKLGLDSLTLNHTFDLLSNALSGQKQLTREEVTNHLEMHGMKEVGRRLSHIFYRAGQEGIICFGTKKGNQHTYTLLDEWVGDTRLLSRQESLAELATRYFQSHGPATLQDFTRWSGLSPKDSKTALGLISSDFREELMNGKNYYWRETGDANHKKDPLKSVYLLPGFDEYVLGYADKTACLEERNFKKVFTRNGMFLPVVIDKGKVTGIWKRTIEKLQVRIELAPFENERSNDKRLLAEYMGYAKFIGMDLKE